jgi:hypothetical protein
MYFWEVAVSRLPGKQFAVWGAVLVLVSLMRSMGVPKIVTAIFTLTYVLFALYTWVAGPLTSAWIRLRPPR